MVNETIAIVLGYLLGSIPSAYIITRIVTGKDIRQLGSGNIGILNTYRAVGVKAGVAVTIIDIGKGAAVIAIAHWLLGVPQLFVVLAGLAAVIGHMWMVFLKFSGGRGMATAIGALATTMSIYGYWYGFLIFLAIVVIPLIITHNFALAMFIGLVLLPLIIWMITHSGWATILSAILMVLIGAKFLPTAMANWAKAKNIRDFIRNY